MTIRDIYVIYDHSIEIKGIREMGSLLKDGSQ